MIFCDDDEKFFFFEPAKLLFLLFSVFAGLDFNYLLSDFTFLRKWRRARDSNPRAPRRAASFQDWCIQPLYQLSVDRFMGFDERIQAVVVVTRRLFSDLFAATHIWLKSFWNRDTSIFLLIVFKNRNQRPTHSEA